MVSVEGSYYGPLQLADAQRLVDDLQAGREPIPDLALSRLRSADPNANA
jgi:(2Fe-2S) ferredoxin